MSAEWMNDKILIQRLTTNSTCKVAILFEGKKAKRITMVNIGGSILQDVSNCSINPGESGTGTYRELPSPSSGLEFALSLFKEDDCPDDPTKIATPFKIEPTRIVHLEKDYKTTDDKSVQVLLKTFHFKVSEGDHFHITITIEDVGT